jgi:hypothetical protein
MDLADPKVSIVYVLPPLQPDLIDLAKEKLGKRFWRAFQSF